MRFIKRAQLLGFTLEEIGSLLELDETHACAETRELAARKLEVIEDKLADLKAMRKASSSLVRECDTGRQRAPARTSTRWPPTDAAPRCGHWPSRVW